MMARYAKPLVLASAVAGSVTLFFGIAYLGANALLPPSPDGGLWSLCVWDCRWYRSIALLGYDHDPGTRGGAVVGLEANYAFFPAFPTIAALLMKVTSVSFTAAGFLLNSLSALLFCWIALIHRRELGIQSDREVVIFLLAFLLSPWSLYNHVPYSEMLFNLAALGTFVLWRRQNFLLAAVFGAVLTATRVTGILLPLILLAELLIRERGRVVEIALQPDNRFRSLALMPIGLMAFMIYLAITVGDPLAHLRIQHLGWGHDLRNPFESVAAIAAGGGGFTGYYNLAAWILVTGLLVAGLLVKRIPPALAAFAWIAPSISLLSTHFSQARFALAL